MDGPSDLVPQVTDPLVRLEELKREFLKQAAPAAAGYIAKAQREGITLVFTYGADKAGEMVSTNGKRAQELVDALRPLDAAGVRDVLGLAAGQLGSRGVEGHNCITYTFRSFKP